MPERGSETHTVPVPSPPRKHWDFLPCADHVQSRGPRNRLFQRPARSTSRRPVNAARIIGVCFLTAGCLESVMLEELTGGAIGPKGGRIVSADGTAALRFAPGALVRETEITMRVKREPRPRLVSPIYELGPTGITFAAPVSLTISVDAGGSSSLVLANIDTAAPSAVHDSTQLDAERAVRGTLQHLSSYGVFETAGLCADKACGARCSICDADDAGCLSAEGANVCGPSGRCEAAAAGLCPPSPCGCDADCPDNELCWDGVCDGAIGCRAAAPCPAGKSCMDGRCLRSIPYVPCARKSCGDFCRSCDPADPGCVEDTVVKACDATGACVPNHSPECPPCASDADCGPCSECQAQICTTRAAKCHLRVSASDLDFGTVEVGSSAERWFLITNTGTSACTFESPSLTGGEFVSDSAVPIPLGRGDAASVFILYTPTDLGTDELGVEISTVDATSPSFSIWLRGEGESP